MRNLLLVPAILLATPLAAQERAVLRGTITDSTSGEPVRRAYVWLGDRRFARADSDGTFLVDSIAPGRYRLQALCVGIGGPMRPQLLWQEEVEIVAGQAIVRSIFGNAKPCDQRPLFAITGKFRGFFESGFEHSRFVPCATPVAGLPPSLDALRNDSIWVWARFKNGAVRRPWPAGATRRDFTRWYIEWQGTIRGPYQYGHLGVAEYEVEVDSVRTVRKPNRRDCSTDFRPR